MHTTAPIIVLYLEHDKDSCEMLFTLLGYDRINVVCVNDPEKVASVAQTSQADLFLLADKFDDPSATNLCRTLRTDFPNKPIIFYSASARGLDIQKGFAAGADAYLLKPDSDKIVSTIKTLMERYEGFADVKLRQPDGLSFPCPTAFAGA